MHKFQGKPAVIGSSTTLAVGMLAKLMSSEWQSTSSCLRPRCVACPTVI